MNYQRLYLGSLRHCSLLAGDRLCVRGGAGLRDGLLGGTGCWEGAKCFRDRLLGIGGLFVEILIAGAGCWLQFGLCCGR